MTSEQYHAAVEWLYVQAPNYQADGIKAYKPGLGNIRKLCEFFGNPQKLLRMVHVAGTNGKGSTCHMLASVLQEAGYRVGLYSSPHLTDFTERIKIDGQHADRQFVYQFIQKLKNLPADIQPSFFEFTTVMAFEYFAENKVDIAVIETGLGGRLDSTNIIASILTAITNVALDHTQILGNTVLEIAKEKGGIIKESTPLISGAEQPEVKLLFQEMCAHKKAPFFDATQIEVKYHTDLQGDYQQKNLRVVQALVDHLRSLDYQISPEALQAGLSHVQKNTGFVGRWTVLRQNPLVVCDTAHNHAGLQEVFTQLNKIPGKKHVVLGFVNDKKIDEVLEILPSDSTFYFVKPNISRGRNPEDYVQSLDSRDVVYTTYQTVAEGFDASFAEAGPQETIFVGGSNFVVGDFLHHWRRNDHPKD